MSISTLESPGSIRALATAHGAQDERAGAEQAAREEIAAGFGLMRTTPSMLIALPRVEVKYGSLRVGSMSLQAALRDLMMEGYGFEQLLAVLQVSDCPFVQKLREALCQEYQRQNASDVAEARE